MTSTALCTTTIAHADTSSLAPEAEALLYGPGRLPPVLSPDISSYMQASSAGLLADATPPPFRRQSPSYPRPAFSTPYPPVLYQVASASPSLSAHWSHTIIVSSAGARYVDPITRAPIAYIPVAHANDPMSYGASAALPDRSMSVDPHMPVPPPMMPVYSHQDPSPYHWSQLALVSEGYDGLRRGYRSHKPLLPPPLDYPESRLEVDPTAFGVNKGLEPVMRSESASKIIAPVIARRPKNNSSNASRGTSFVDSVKTPPQSRRDKKTESRKDSQAASPLPPPVAITPLPAVAPPPPIKIEPPSPPSLSNNQSVTSPTSPPPSPASPPSPTLPPPLTSSPTVGKKPLRIQPPATEDESLLPVFPEKTAEKIANRAVQAVENASKIKSPLTAKQDVIALIAFLPEVVQLDDKAKTALDRVAKTASDDPGTRLRLVAHADKTDSGRRIALSRGIAVRKYLIDNKQIDLARIDLRIRAYQDDSDPINRVAVQLLR